MDSPVRSLPSTHDMWSPFGSRIVGNKKKYEYLDHLKGFPKHSAERMFSTHHYSPRGFKTETTDKVHKGERIHSGGGKKPGISKGLPHKKKKRWGGETDFCYWFCHLLPFWSKSFPFSGTQSLYFQNEGTRINESVSFSIAEEWRAKKKS